MGFGKPIHPPWPGDLHDLLPIIPSRPIVRKGKQGGGAEPDAARVVKTRNGLAVVQDFVLLDHFRAEGWREGEISIGGTK